MLAFFKDELKARKSLKVFFLQPNFELCILQNIFFLFAVKKYISKGFLKFCKLISNLILGQIIVLNLTNVHKLAAYTVLACIRKNKNIKYNNNYSGLTFKMQPLKSIK